MTKSNIPQNIVEINNKVQEYMHASLIATNLEKSWVSANAVAFLRENMTEEFMKPIMALQGTKIGFLTDKDKKKVDGRYVKGDGYDISIVKDTCIEALMNGLELNGNLFNIIADRFYITREGFEYLLNKTPGLDYDFDCTIPVQSSDNKSAEVTVVIHWEIDGNKKSKTLPLRIKSDQWAGADSIIGKAKRKAGCWLVNKLKGTNFADGDASEVENKEVVIDLDELNRARMEELKELFTKEVSSKIDAHDKSEAKRKEEKPKGYAEKIQKVIDSNPPQYSNVQASIDFINKILTEEKK
jgi:hypothetical protein